MNFLDTHSKHGGVCADVSLSTLRDSVAMRYFVPESAGAEKIGVDSNSTRRCPLSIRRCSVKYRKVVEMVPVDTLKSFTTHHSWTCRLLRYAAD